MISALDIGNYSFAEAARFTKLRPARVREWFRGKTTGRPSLLESDFPSSGRDTAISFSDLVDVFVAGQLREHGVKLTTLRKVYQSLRQRYHVAHPFCRVELQTDGKRVFSIGLSDAGREEVTEVLVGQRVFPEIIKPFLKALDYDEATGMALQWRVAPHVVLNPKLHFGRPVVDGACLPTSLLAAAHKANGGDPECVADWYGTTAAQVEAAVHFENQFRVRVAA